MADELKTRHELPVQIRFNDVDLYGHMNNSSYFSLYDLAKTSYMRDVFGNEEWNKMGGKVIITSDAHDTASLTFGFDEAAEAVKAAGFSSVEVLTVNGFETQEL